MTQNDLPWPSGCETAGLIRDFDWAASPLGPIAAWPQSLRTAVDIVLAMPGPATLLWGPAYVQIYNDAYIPIARDRHPALLGRSVAEGWPEIYEAVVAPLLAETAAGRAIQWAGYAVTLRDRDGGSEERVFDAAFSPIRDEAGTVAGALQTLSEVTDAHRARTSLRASEERYRQLFDAIDEGFCIIEVLFEAGRPADYRFVSVNAAFCQQTGLHDAVGRRMRELAPAHEEHWFETYGRIALTGEPERFESRAEALGRWFDVFAFRTGAPEQRQVGILFKDVGVRRRAEAALRNSEMRLRAFVSASADVVYRMSPDWSRMHRLDGQGFLVDTAEPSATWMDRYIHPDDQAAVRAAIARAVGAGTMFELEHKVRQADGSLGWTLSRAVPIVDEDGAVVEWLGAAGDITRRREVQEALRESEVRFRGLVEGFGQTAWEADADGVIVADSPAWRAFTGQRLEEWLGYGWLDAIHPDDRAGTERKWRETIAARRPVDAEYRLWHAASGSWRWSNVRAVPLTDPDGRIRKWAGMNIDVTERHAAQERQAVLVAELQHRTRNLMSVVRALADRTLAGSADLADFRMRFSDRLAALARVQGLLSRLDEWDRVTFDMLVHTELTALGGEAERIGLDGPAGVALRSSTVQTFALALHELTTNALKYGALAQPLGRLVITWRLERAQRDGRPWLHVDWRERGVRMPPPSVASPGGGSGRELIERALPYQLGAETTYVMEDDGVHCTIALPVSERQVTRDLG
ncbi:MAG: PAS domain S-box protein [Methylobacterium frigidaeris]